MKNLKLILWGTLGALIPLTSGCGDQSAELDLTEADAISSLGASTLTPVRRFRDLNGDGKDNFLWRHNNGQVLSWGTTINSGAGNDWSIIGVGDLDGNGKSGLIWRNLNNTLTTWYEPTLPFSGVSREWELVAVADIDGDGRDNLMWWNASIGRLTVWGNGNYNVGIGWNLVGTGHFNSNGPLNLVWRHSTSGQLVVWGTNINETRSLSWQVAAIGDFDGNGTDEILWRHTNGAISGTVYNGTNVSTSWHIVGSGDVDGDGTDELAWRNDSGAFTVWGASGFPGGVGFDWSVQPQAERLPARNSACGNSAGCLSVSSSGIPAGRTINAEPLEDHYYNAYYSFVPADIGSIRAGEKITITGSVRSVVSSSGSVAGTDYSDYLRLGVPAGVTVSSTTLQATSSVHYCGINPTYTPYTTTVDYTPVPA
ncbi:MAG: VCBS repeat-containing protein, partial [Myxococcota bacterium]